MTENVKPCDKGFGFTVSDCPDWGSSDCPKTVPGAKCLMDDVFAKEILEAKWRYYARKAER